MLFQEVPAYKLFSSERLPDWEDLRKAFKLQVGPGEFLGASHDGYVPFICRLVQMVARGEAASLGMRQESLLKKNKTPLVKSFKKDEEKPHERVFVFVIGGMTMSEAALIRGMGKNVFQGTCEFCLGTTSILSPTRMVEEMVPTIVKSVRGSGRR
jgi:hypothetical protein